MTGRDKPITEPLSGGRGERSAGPGFKPAWRFTAGLDSGVGRGVGGNPAPLGRHGRSRWERDGGRHAAGTGGRGAGPDSERPSGGEREGAARRSRTIGHAALLPDGRAARRLRGGPCPRATHRGANRHRHSASRPAGSFSEGVRTTVPAGRLRRACHARARPRLRKPARATRETPAQARPRPRARSGASLAAPAARPSAWTAGAGQAWQRR
jgi:hypothetical protein